MAPFGSSFSAAAFAAETLDHLRRSSRTTTSLHFNSLILDQDQEDQEAGQWSSPSVAAAGEDEEEIGVLQSGSRLSLFLQPLLLQVGVAG